MDAPLLYAILAVPAVGAVLGAFAPGARSAIGIALATVVAAAGVAIACAVPVFASGPVYAAGDWLFVDALSALHLLVMMGVFCLSSLYAVAYFGEEIRHEHFTRRQARQFASLWCGSLCAMTLALISNNLGTMWVGIEATTLLTAFLVSVHVSRESLEAMWKYVIICSVGVGFAFVGTLLVAASAKGTGLGPAEMLLWTSLRRGAALLDPSIVRAAFIFVLIGYGTKAGLAPMHNWLPDAHSQAPAPVSALFSGFMLNAAFYCIMRYMVLAESVPATAGLAPGLVTGIGVLSILVAAAFIPFQTDLKRLLAYSSVEHLGIVAVGIGLGGLGTLAALFHTVNHSIGKSLAFFSAGRLGQMAGTHDLKALGGAVGTSRVWGTGVFGALLALIGLAPFAIFMSKFLILRAAAAAGAWWSFALVTLGCAIVFIGALKHAIPLAWGTREGAATVQRAGTLEAVIVVAALVALLALGVWMPPPLRSALEAASNVLKALPAGAVAATAGVNP